MTSKKLPELSKENFWAELIERYPKAVAQLDQWLTNYKEDNVWKELFNEGFYKYPLMVNSVIKTKSPKFHDLPFAMQVGIFFQFMADAEGVVENFEHNSKAAIINTLEKFEVIP